jgi:hypothetical protein
LRNKKLQKYNNNNRMEENLIDSSKYRISLMSIDSRFASQKNYRNGEFRINIPFPLKNVMRVRMASAEIPLVAYTFSLKNGNTTFAVKLGASPTFIKCTPIPDGNYSLNNLISAIQTSLQLFHSGFSVSFDQTSGKVTIENSSLPFEIYLASYDENISLRPANWGIGYNIGFRKSTLKAELSSGTTYFVRGTSILSLQAAPYYLLQLECPEAVENLIHPLLKDAFITAFAKVILKDNAYTYQFDDNSNLVRKEFTYLAPHTLPYFVVRLVDGWGKTVDMQDCDWSITLEITEVVNSKTYASISNTYSRK